MESTARLKQKRKQLSFASTSVKFRFGKLATLFFPIVDKPACGRYNVYTPTTERNTMSITNDPLQVIYDNDLIHKSIEDAIAEKFETGVSIYEHDGKFILRWTDFVANEWAEEFPTMSVALLRLATLIACGESGWRNGFQQEPDGFTNLGKDFLAMTC